MEFYDLYVPGEDYDEIIETACEMGFHGIGLTHRYENKDLLNRYLEDMDEIGREDIDIVRCCEINAKTAEEMKRAVGKVRQRVDIVEVVGGNFDINATAAKDRRVDILLHPEYKRKDPGMDHKTTKMAAKNEVTVGFVLHDLQHTYGKVRSHVINHIKKSIGLCKKYEAEFIVTSGAKNIYGLRSPRDLASLLQVLGIGSSESMDAISTIPKKIVRKNRKKLGGKIKRGGVEEV